MGTECDCSAFNQSVPVLNETSLIDYDIPITTRLPIPEVEIETTPSYFNTSIPDEQQEQIEKFCRDEISAEYVFESMSLDPSSLLMYWGIIFGICIALRLLSMFLLYVISNDGMSWFKNTI